MKKSIFSLIAGVLLLGLLYGCSEQSDQASGEIKVGDVVTGLKVFRDELYIFCQRRIYKVTGTSSSNFALAEVAKNVGTIAHHSIQEVSGDLLFLSADGVRTVAGTERIGDVELGTVSKQIQDRINDITYDNVTLLVIRDKSQYRLFYPKTTGVESNSKGIIAVIKVNPNTNQLGYEYADIKGLKKPTTVWMDDATYKDVSGKATFTQKETDAVTKILSQTGKTFQKINSPY